jgi:hypothetical protein
VPARSYEEDAMATPGAFDKDFGYLMPFLDRVSAAAAELSDAAAREELVRLMAEEKARWARIQELLGGAPGRGAPAGRGAEAPISPTSPGVPSTAPQAARASSDDVNRVAPWRVGLTVGSLKRSSS